MLLQQTPAQYTAQGESALYDAIKAGIQMTDEAPGEQDAIRSVVALTDRKNTTGNIMLHDLIVMRVGSECLVKEFGDHKAGAELVDQCTGTPVGDGQIGEAPGLRELVDTLQAHVKAQGEELEAWRREVQALHVLLQQDHNPAADAKRPRYRQSALRGLEAGELRHLLLPAAEGRPWWRRLWPGR